MTQHELATMLREHVTRDEPTPPLPDTAIRTGRRKLRSRRLTEAGAVLTVAAVVGAALVTWNHHDDQAPSATAMDPISARALERYDALQMPRVLDEHVRQVLEQSVPDLGDSQFTAYDDQMTELPEKYWDKASSLKVTFGTDHHEYSASIAHARSNAEGDPDEYCASGLAGGYYLECTVARTDAGDVVISTLEATQPMRADTLGTIVQEKDLDTVPLDTLSFSHTVKVIKSETLVTYVTEKVKATDRDPATADFTTPYEDLADIGTDPELVMPVPPPGENGCPAWSMPRPNVIISCATSRD